MIGVTAVAAVIMGVPTGIIPSRFFVRMTAVLWWNYPVWAVSAVLTGLIVATYVRSPHPAAGSGTGRVTAGGVLSVFAIGCPICNKLVVALIGLSGALNVGAPVQPWLGLASVALLGFAFHTRPRRAAVCPIPRPPVPAESRLDQHHSPTF